MSYHVNFTQPWFEPDDTILTANQYQAFHSFFSALEENVSKIMTQNNKTPETSITAGLVQTINGIDSKAYDELAAKLMAENVEVTINANEFPMKPKNAGETLDFMVEFIVMDKTNNVQVHRILLVEAKKMYPGNEGVFSEESRFKELNKPEESAGNPRIRSILQARTIMGAGARAGAFVLYCPQVVADKKVGLRVLFPESVFLLPKQPTLRHVIEDTIPFPEFMIRHFFFGRRGIDIKGTKDYNVLKTADSPIEFSHLWSFQLKKLES